jgi:hypothetical protein
LVLDLNPNEKKNTFSKSEDLDSNKGPGPDGVPPLILKNCASAFALPLCLLFNRSLASCVFPDWWKFSFVTLIFKSGKRNEVSNVSNYHGIAILSTVGILFELLVYGQMYEDLKDRLADCQHGIVKDRSTVSNLLEYSSCFEVCNAGFNP